MNAAHRSVLLLQGPAGPFFHRLGQALVARGHGVHKIHFNGGDAVFWRGGGCTSYRGGPADWPARCAELLDQHQVTDLVLFGDCRPLHQAAIGVAAQRGVRVMVAEEGYIRPDWITFEQDGVNGHSALPREPDWFRREAGSLRVGSGVAVDSHFLRRAAEDVAYNLAAVLGRAAYPLYRSHRPWHPAAEYAGWLKRCAGLAAARWRSGRRLEWLAAAGLPYFLFPLQLDCDFQIRVHSPFAHQTAAMGRVLGSFARWAPPEALLVVKQHPLENGLRNWRARLGEIAERLDIADRVVFIESGDLAQLSAGAAGMVTVNSTSGMVALGLGVPVIALGTAIYDLPGLTSRGSLDAFWRAPVRPDATLFAALRTVLIARCLVPGGFYSDAGLNLAVAGAVARLEQPPRAVLPAPLPAGRALPPQGEATRGEAMMGLAMVGA